MKYLLVLFVVWVGVWVWRSNRAGERPPSRRTKPPADSAVDMVGCDLCGLHCPNGDLIVGRKGVYCCTQHQHQAED